MTAIGRLLAHENTASDLLAYLIELDALPLAQILGLPADEYTAQREVRIGGRGGRPDLLIRRSGGTEPLAVLELKGAADEHNGQLERYATWAASEAAAAQLRYCTLDGDAAAPPKPWQPLSLVQLFGAWHQSRHSHARWLSVEITDVLQGWDTEADRTIGKVRGWYVPDLITRRIAAALGDDAQATRTKAGNPMVLAYRRHLGAPDDAWIGVDLRCAGRDAPQRDWLFRPFVEVSFSNPTPVAQAAARRLATHLRPAMMFDAIQQVIKDPDALRTNRHGGLLSHPSTGPVFYHDKQVRLATQFSLVVDRVNRHDVADMISTTIHHLDRYLAATTTDASADQPGRVS
ncbi:hypothetical protein AB0C12_36135 [Actinoplanes sp. NPDC048967]|uniref:hypothetical protein n=1 Tax=Actinoplanes sp. NPDC048967 TaxID=3155269 RepID=UPI0034050F70